MQRSRRGKVEGFANELPLPCQYLRGVTHFNRTNVHFRPLLLLPFLSERMREMVAIWNGWTVTPNEWGLSRRQAWLGSKGFDTYMDVEKRRVEELNPLAFPYSKVFAAASLKPILLLKPPPPPLSAVQSGHEEKKGNVYGIPKERKDICSDQQNGTEWYSLWCFHADEYLRLLWSALFGKYR